MNQELIVSISDGKLKGTTGASIDGEPFYKFQGIRYGKPPINELRFMPPQPVEPWSGIHDATKPGNTSISRDELTGEVGGSEDCLFLNVYTRKLPSPNTKSRPVMVYIHGGGFVAGSSRPGLCGPEFFMTQDVVLVTMNYRLGVLGFLSVNGTDVTGNMGLKDQNLALKWVRKYISKFNGDPDNVTLFGESAGAASVHAHILSPMSKGLFHKAILQSGCALNFWFYGSKDYASKIVALIGQPSQNELEALEILKKVPAADIFSAQDKLPDIMNPSLPRTISPVVESSNKNGFLTEDPREIIKKGTYNKVPMIMGFTDTEGMLVDVIFKQAKIEPPPFQIKTIIPSELPSQCVDEVEDTLLRLYGKDIGNYDKWTDSWFLAGIIETISLHLKTMDKPIYLYRMSIKSDLNYLKNSLELKGIPITYSGVCHADDLGYIWHSDITPKIEPGSIEDRYFRIFIKLWTNFAEFGKPVAGNELKVKWEPVKGMEKLQVLDIGDPIEIKDIPEKNRVEVWQKIYEKWPPRKHI